MKRLPALLTGNVLFGAGLFFHAFLYNFYLEGVGHSPIIMGRAAAALTAGGLLALVPAGRLVDRLGPALVSMIGAGAAAAGLTVGAMTTSPGSVYAAAMLAGAGTAAWRVSGGPFLMGLVTGPARARAFSWNVACLVGSGGLWMAAAGALPGAIARALGVASIGGQRMTLLLGALITAISIPFFARAGLSLDRIADSPAGARPTAETNHPLGDRALIGMVGLVAFWMTAPALVSPFFNLYFARTFSLTLQPIGLIFALSHAVTAVVIFGSGEAAARIGARRALTAWMLALGPLLLALAWVPTVGVAVALYLLQGMVSPATNPLIDQLLLERAPASRRGSIASWRNAATEGSGVIGATVGGAVLAGGSFVTLLATAGVMALLAAVVLSGRLARVQS